MGEDRARDDRSREHEQTTAPQPLGGLQGQGGARRRRRRQDDCEIAQKHDVHPNQVSEWRRQLLDRAAEVFGAPSAPAEPAVDLKALHAKIGQLALENDFLVGSLTRVGLLSAKR